MARGRPAPEAGARATQQADGFEHRPVTELAVEALGYVAQEVEGLILAEALAVHQDADGSPDRAVGLQGRPEVLGVLVLPCGEQGDRGVRGQDRPDGARVAAERAGLRGVEVQ